MTITKKFDMQFMRYMNLFARVTGISPKHCFAYNNMLVFIIPGFAIERAIGRDNTNLKKLSSIFGKRIRVLAEPTGLKDLGKFVKILVYPVEFDKVEILETTTEGNNIIKEAVVTTSNREQKAMLIGRDRAREAELKNILEQYFGTKSVRIN